jgi:hypothetical protein
MIEVIVSIEVISLAAPATGEDGGTTVFMFEKLESGHSVCVHARTAATQILSNDTKVGLFLGFIFENWSTTTALICLDVWCQPEA